MSRRRLLTDVTQACMQRAPAWPVTHGTILRSSPLYRVSRAHRVVITHAAIRWIRNLFGDALPALWPAHFWLVLALILPVMVKLATRCNRCSAAGLDIANINPLEYKGRPNYSATSNNILWSWYTGCWSVCCSLPSHFQQLRTGPSWQAGCTECNSPSNG